MIETTRKVLMDIAAQLDEASDAGMMGLVSGFLVGIAGACDCLEEMVPLAVKITACAAQEMHDQADKMFKTTDEINNLVAQAQALHAQRHKDG